MHRHRLLIALASVTLVATACGDDDDSANETVPALPTGPATPPPTTATVAPPTSAAPTTVPETPAPLTVPDTTVPPTTVATTVPTTTTLPATTVPATTVPETTVVETTTVETTLAPETTVPPATTVPETTVVETTLAPETTVVETTVAPETTIIETTLAPETTIVETTLAPETTVVETTVAPETTVVETTVAPETTVPPASLPISDIVVLNSDGLGLVAFGDEPEAAVAAVTAVLGVPTEDTGPVDPLTISACAGTELRRVTWGSLTLYFGDESPIAQGTPHLFAYSYGNVEDLEGTPVGLATPEGIGLGTTVQFLRAAYPEVVIEPGEEGVVDPTFFVNDSLSGFLTGGNDDDLVTIIVGGDRCGV